MNASNWPPHGQDRRRRLTLEERRLLYDRAGGYCQRDGCGAVLGVDWHSAHLTAWANGGATSIDTMEAWCPPCNLHLGARDVPGAQLQLRRWQEQALPDILGELYRTGQATVHAAPGAGKTIFAGAVYQQLRATGLVDRILIVVPNRVLVRQWSESLARNLQIHVDVNPHLGWREHPDTAGAIVTYANCANAAQHHGRALRAASTLVVFDEVHHLADQRSWGKAAHRMITDDAGERVATILNTTGTLFRSGGSEQIPTVRYRDSEDELGRSVREAVADYSVGANELIGRELRPVDLHTCGSTIQLVDLTEGEVISGEVADLPNPKLMRATHARMITDADWMEGFARHMLDMLARQAHALDHREHLKALWVAKDQRCARKAAEIIDRVAATDFARLVISDEPKALRDLDRAVRDPRPCCIVAVQMVTEGFDCAQVSTIAYAHNITAELYLTQMVARAMRLTPTERAEGRVLPAQVLIPDLPDLRQAFINVLVSKLHTVLPDEDEQDGTLFGPDGRDTGGLRLPRYDLTEVSIPRLDDTVVIGEADGRVTRPEVEAMSEILAGLGLGGGAANVFAPRAVVASRHFSQARVLRDRMPIDLTTRSANPRDINLARRDQAKRCAGWWVEQGDTPISHFQADANRAAGIAGGGRDNATPEVMDRMVGWMTTEIRARCQRAGLNPPPFLASEEEVL